MNTPLYTLQRITKSDKLIGPAHAADTDLITICGQDIDENWWIINNTSTGTITCKECLNILKKESRNGNESDR